MKKQVRLMQKIPATAGASNSVVTTQKTNASFIFISTIHQAHSQP